MSESFANMMSGYRDWLMVGASIMPLAICSPALAADDEAVVLDDVVISANRTETSIKSVGCSVTVITAKDIENSKALTAAEVINRAPGVYISNANGGVGSYNSMFGSMRGVSLEHVKILVDGVQVSSLSNILASSIERIEVLKGNQSTLYGSNAMGGVISITTKSGKNSDKLIAGSAFAEYGTDRSFKVGGTVNGRHEKVYYDIGVTQYDTDGYDISDDTGGSENDGYENVSIHSRLGADVLEDVGVLDKLNLEYIMRFTDAEHQMDNMGSMVSGAYVNGYPSDAFSVSKSNLSQHKVQIKADMFDGVLSNELSASHSTTSTDSFVSGQRSTSDKDTKTRTSKYEYRGVLKPVDDHTIVYGADYEKMTIKNGNFQRSQQGVYGNYQLELLDKALTLTAGARYDKADAVPGQLTYRGTIGYYLDSTGTRFHASYGTGFQTPSSDQLQGGVNDLDPEKSRSYDVGVEQSFFDDRVVLDVTAFNSRIKDEIVYVGVVGGQWIYDNVSSMRSFGVETSLSAEVTSELSLEANLTYQEPKNIAADASATWRPKKFGSALITYEPEAVNGLSTWVRGEYRGTNRDFYPNTQPCMGGFVKYDVGASYEWDHGITFYGKVDNVLDKNYQTKANFAMPGIVGTIGARVSF